MKKIAGLILILFALLAQPPAVVLAHSPTQSGGCTTASPSADPSIGPTPTVCRSIRADLQATTETFAVSWLSFDPAGETGQLQLVGDSSVPDLRAADFAGTTHYVTLSIPQPNANYRLDIVSGVNTYDNNGSHWSFAGPALAAPGRDNILARVKNPDGSDAEEAIVYVTIQHANDGDKSALLSQIMTAADAGGFTINLAYARTPDFSARFTYNKTTDKLLITAVGPTGTASVTVNTGDPRPSKPRLTLTLGSGTGTAATATPSPIPPTSTPTPVTPSATPTLPPATATAFAATQTAAAFTATPTATRVRPTATRVRPTATPTLELAPMPSPSPSDTLEAITVEPAAPTEIAEATGESSIEPSPETTRLAPRLATPPGANSAVAALLLNNDILGLLALIAFIGAVVLGGAALFFWKR